MRLGPHRREECLLRHQLAGMRHEIAQHGKRLGGEQQALVVCRLPVAPETLVDGIQPEWRELLHARPSTVGIGAIPQGFGLEVELRMALPGLSDRAAEALVTTAHEVCPYANATRGNIAVRLVLVSSHA